MGGFADHMGLLAKVRGAWGHVLKASASPSSRNEHPCLWTPPCALDVFFGKKPVVKSGRHQVEIPKPYILFSRNREGNLVVGLTLFGFACDWVHVAEAALIDALRNHVNWRALAGDDLFLPSNIDIEHRNLKTLQGLKGIPCPDNAAIEFETPLSAEKADIADIPYSFITRLARRLSGLARWHDVVYDPHFNTLRQTWDGCDIEIEVDEPLLVKRGSSRQHRVRTHLARQATLHIGGDIEELWPLLRLGETSHVGRGAVTGLGRYRLVY